MYLIAIYEDGKFHDWVKTGKNQIVVHEGISSAKKSRNYHQRMLSTCDFRIISLEVGEEVDFTK